MNDDEKFSFLKKALYTVEEFGEIVGCGKTFTYDILKEGHIKAVKIANKTLITREYIVKYLMKLPKYKPEDGDDGAPTSPPA